MAGDLVSLRMLLVAAARPDRELWRHGAAQASIPVDFLAEDAVSAGNTLARGGVDICIIDAELPDAYKAAMLTVARKVKPSPLVFVSSPPGGRRFDGVDGMLPKPESVDAARKVAEICIRAKIPTRVLIVDDSGTMRSIVRKILSASRFALDIYEASEGIAALNQLRTGKFSLVFLDYNMPGFNGLETLSEIKRESPNVAVVMMTAITDSAVVDRAQASGALAFLKKPFFPADIDVVLARYYGFNEPLN